MALFPQAFLDDLRMQADIVQVVQETVSLRRVGSRYVGLCPFHNEKSPSFGVNREQGLFHCFGCGVGGNVFKFVELHERLSFPEAVRVLAKKFGVAIPERKRRQPRCGRRRRAREPDRAARSGGEVLSRGAGVRRRPARPRAARPARPRPADHRVARLRLRAAGPRHAALAPEEQGPRSEARGEGGAGGGSRRAAVGSLLEPPDDPDLPRDRPGRGLRRPGDGSRSGPEVPEQPGDADLLEGPHALWPERDARPRSASRAGR